MAVEVRDTEVKKMAIPYKKTRKSSGRKSKRPDNATLNDLYIVQDKTCKEIAEIYGVAVSTVRGWLAAARKGR